MTPRRVISLLQSVEKSSWKRMQSQGHVRVNIHDSSIIGLARKLANNLERIANDLTIRYRNTRTHTSPIHIQFIHTP